MTRITPFKPRLDAASWDALCDEREAIMHHDGNLALPLARAKAISETTKRFGPRPRERSNP